MPPKVPIRCHYFLILSALLIGIIQNIESQLTSSNNDGGLDRLKHLEDKFSKQEERVALVELQNKDHLEEIASLHFKVKKLKNEVDHLKEQNNNNKKESLINSNDQEKHISEDSANMGFKSSIEPSSCNDLNNLGHRHSGFYLVKAASNSKMDAVFCNFNPNSISNLQETADSTIIGRRIGHIDVKSTGISFFVQRDTKMSVNENKEVIRYNVARLNNGDAMNLGTGVFTAPVAGTYFFSFVASKHGKSYNFLGAHLRLNGVVVASGFSGALFYPSMLSIHSTLKLKVGDRIDVFKFAGELHSDPISYIHTCHFSGLLLEEDLIF